MPSNRVSVRDLTQRIYGGESDIHDAMQRLIDRLGEREPEIARLIQRRISPMSSLMDIEEAVRQIGPEKLANELLRPAIEDTVRNNFEAEMHNTTIPGMEGGMSFTVTNKRAMDYVSSAAQMAQLKITEEMTDAVRLAVRRAFEQGGHPYEIARQIRDVVGLTENGVKAVQNYEDFLNSLAAHPERALAQTNAERLGRVGFKNGSAIARQGLTKDRISQLVEKYRAKLTKERAQTIARTLVIDASAAGRIEAWQQAVDNGELAPGMYQMEWIAAPSERTCPKCAALDGKKRDWNGAYEDGTARPPRHVNCRCSEALVRKAGAIGVAEQFQRKVMG